MEDYGLVSIITPAYNCSAFIKDTIESVVAQTYTNWEMLITDDCSTDETRSIIESYAEKDSRIKYFCLPTNSGAGVARNYSIEQAKGRYISLLDSDDRWFPTKLQKELDFMHEKDCAVVYCSYLTCNEDGSPHGIIVCRRHETAFSVKCDDRMGAITFMYDIEKCGGKIFTPSIRKRQDWCYKMLMLEKAKDAYGIKEPLGIYRLVGNSLSRNKKKLIRYNIEAYHVTFGWSWLKSVLFFIFIFSPNYTFKKIEHKFINR